MIIWGVQIGGAWSFKMESSDHTPTLIDEAAIIRETAWVRSINDAVEEVGWAWNAMAPRFVHPDFGKEIFRVKEATDKVRHYGGRNTPTWAGACGVELPPVVDVSSVVSTGAANVNGREVAVKGHAVSFKKSQRVRHSSKSDWGLGIVSEDSNQQSVHVRFEQGGDRLIALPTAYLEVIKDDF